MELDDFTIELSFRHNRSARYPSAVSRARKFPGYSQHRDPSAPVGGMSDASNSGRQNSDGLVHAVTIAEELGDHETFSRFVALLRMTSSWGGTAVSVSGERLPTAALDRLTRVAECYERQRRAGNRRHYCNGFDPRHAPEYFGCRLLSSVNRQAPLNGEDNQSPRAWYRIGELAQSVFTVHKKTIVEMLTGDAERTLAFCCPVFGIGAVRCEVETLPDTVDLDTDARWTVENRPDGIVGIRMRATGPARVARKPQESTPEAHAIGPAWDASAGGAPVEERDVPPVEFADVCGQASAVSTVRDWVELPLRYPEMFERVGVPTKVGILLHGPPGTGKTLLAQAVAGECKAHLETVSGPEILSKWVGQSEAALRAMFDRARRLAPSVVLLDEIDAISPMRDRALHVHEVTLVSQLLTILDGLY